MSIVSLRSVFIGILATVTMDLLSVTASKLGLIAFLPPRLMGRWFAYLVRGEFLHSDIAQMPPIHYEMAMAVPGHYAVGITLAFVYLSLNSTHGVDIHNLAAALGFALCTSLLPWLLMFPAMGYGWFGTHGPPGTRLFPSSLVTHGFYGVGLWLGALLLTQPR
jgi:hypothetical protein